MIKAVAKPHGEHMLRAILIIVIALVASTTSGDVFTRDDVMLGLDTVRQKLVGGREGKKISYVVDFGVEGLPITSSGVASEVTREIEVYYFGDEWVIHERSKKRPNPLVEVSNEEFWFQMSQVGSLFSLQNSHRTPYRKSSDKNAEDQRQVSVVHSAMNALPGVTFLRILSSNSCTIKQSIRERDLIRVILEVPGNELRPNWSGISEVNGCFDQEWKVMNTSVEYKDSQKGTYRFKYEVQYGNDGTAFPQQVIYSGELVGSPGVDREVYSSFKVAKNDQAPEILQPEYYGIPKSALEGLHPRFPIDIRWIIFSSLALIFLATGVWLSKKRFAGRAN